MPYEIIALRSIHILGGIFWVGSAAFTTFFLVPALATSGANTGQIFAALQQRRLFTVLPTVAIITILTGLRLIWLDSGGFSPQYFATLSGRTFGSAGVAAIVAFLLSLIVTRPRSERAGRLGASIASAPVEQRAALTAEVARLRRQAGLAGNVAMTLMVLSAAGMSLARFLA